MYFRFENKKKRCEPFPKKKPERGYEQDEGILSDVEGSYTGVPLDSGERPVQDADDL